MLNKDRVIIIGAGPAGLYAALAFYKAGITALVFDPRAGEYTRPGRLDQPVLEAAAKFLNLQVVLPKNYMHIKDFERILYEQISNINAIKIEKKKFIRLKEDTETPGVIIADAKGNEEFVAGNYVCDCTGSNRYVLKSANEICAPEIPFTLRAFTEVAASTRYLAYVQMKNEQLLELMNSYNRISSPFVDNIYFARSLIKLRALGWNEFKLPELTGYYVNKNKVCLYLEIPIGLSKTEQDKWLQTVLEIYTASTPDYHYLPQSKKYSAKPRLTTINVETNVVEQTAYIGKNLPMIFPLGDALIDPYYVIGQGIGRGCKGINFLIESMDIVENKIRHFSNNEYQLKISRELREHANIIHNQIKKEEAASIESIRTAFQHFDHAIRETSEESEKIIFSEILDEIRTRKSFADGHYYFTFYHDRNHKLISCYNPPSEISFDSLKEMHLNFFNALKVLPLIAKKERSHTETLLADLAISWQEIGNSLFFRGEFSQAIISYKKALEIYALELPVLQEKKENLNDILVWIDSCYYGLAKEYCEKKQYDLAMKASKNCLAVYTQFKVDKIDNCSAIYLPTSILCSKAQDFLEKNCIQQAQDCYQEAIEQSKTCALEIKKFVMGDDLEKLKKNIELSQQEINSTDHTQTSARSFY